MFSTAGTPAVAASSIHADAWSAVSARPPYSSGQSMPAKPASNSRRCHARPSASRRGGRMAPQSAGPCPASLPSHSRAAARSWSTESIEPLGQHGEELVALLEPREVAALFEDVQRRPRDARGDALALGPRRDGVVAAEQR